jgi:chromosome segregation ATPase
MDGANSIEAAKKRLSLAIDALTAAVERRREVDHAEAKIADQLYTLGTDRSRLAAELDTALARSRRLEETNREIARRLDTTIETVRSVLDAHEG